MTSSDNDVPSAWRKGVAIHEAGHAVAIAVLGLQFGYGIRFEDPDEAYVEYWPRPGDKREARSALVVQLSGTVEQLVFRRAWLGGPGEHPEGLRRRWEGRIPRKISKRFLIDFGGEQSEGDFEQVARGISRLLGPNATEEERAATFEDAVAQARQIINENRVGVLALAIRLYLRGSIRPAEIGQVLAVAVNVK